MLCVCWRNGCKCGEVDIRYDIVYQLLGEGCAETDTVPQSVSHKNIMTIRRTATSAADATSRCTWYARSKEVEWRPDEAYYRIWSIQDAVSTERVQTEATWREGQRPPIDMHHKKTSPCDIIFTLENGENRGIIPGGE